MSQILMQMFKVAIIYGNNWMASTEESRGGRKRIISKIVSMIIKCTSWETFRSVVLEKSLQFACDTQEEP